MWPDSERIPPGDILIALGLTAIGSSGTLFFALVALRLSKHIRPILAYGCVFTCGILFVALGVTHRIKATDT
jgi:hypothetical protein